MNKFLHIFWGVVFCVALSACTAYVDSRRQAGQIEPMGQSKPPVIAVCYNPIFNDDKEVEQIAASACESPKIVYQDTKYFNCALFYPNTAFYKCE